MHLSPLCYLSSHCPPASVVELLGEQKTLFRRHPPPHVVLQLADVPLRHCRKDTVQVFVEIRFGGEGVAMHFEVDGDGVARTYMNRTIDTILPLEHYRSSRLHHDT